jgi:hypothetical protein
MISSNIQHIMPTMTSKSTPEMATATAIARCAGILALLSVLLIVEGVSRINLFIGTPNGKWGGDHSTYPPAVELAASVGLAFFGTTPLHVDFTMCYDNRTK